VATEDVTVVMTRSSSVAAVSWDLAQSRPSRVCGVLSRAAWLTVPLVSAALVLAVVAPRGAARLTTYRYAGIASKSTVGGVAATLEVSDAPAVHDGHVAAWVGVGGPGLGPNGVDEWIQIGFSGFAGESGSNVYYEVKRGTYTAYTPVATGIPVGERHRFAVRESLSRPGWWRVWLDGAPASPPVFLPGSHGAWPAQVVAENWVLDSAACNEFAFGFTDLSVRRPDSGAQIPLTAPVTFADGSIKLSRAGTGFKVRRHCR
jgi:hypothetical protein